MYDPITADDLARLAALAELATSPAIPQPVELLVLPFAVYVTLAAGIDPERRRAALVLAVTLVCPLAGVLLWWATKNPGEGPPDGAA